MPKEKAFYNNDKYISITGYPIFDLSLRFDELSDRLIESGLPEQEIKEIVLGIRKRLSSYYELDGFDSTNIELRELCETITKETLEEIEIRLKTPDDISVKVDIDKIDYPLDPVNRDVWNDKELSVDIEREISVANRKDKNTDKEITISYILNRELLQQEYNIISLNSYDFEVYISIASLFKAGNTRISAAQIYRTMGYSKRPGRNDYEAIYASIEKMESLKITISNYKEAIHYNYKEVDIQQVRLLPIKRTHTKRLTKNNQINAFDISLYEEPILLKFARERNQLTSLPIELIHISGLANTERNLKIKEYLIRDIIRLYREYQDKMKAQRKAEKEGKSVKPYTPTILLKTLYEACDISTSMQKNRALKTIEKVLSHFQECNKYISKFEFKKDRINLTFIK